MLLCILLTAYLLQCQKLQEAKSNRSNNTQSLLLQTQFSLLQSYNFHCCESLSYLLHLLFPLTQYNDLRDLISEIHFHDPFSKTGNFIKLKAVNCLNTQSLTDYMFLMVTERHETVTDSIILCVDPFGESFKGNNPFSVIGEKRCDEMKRSIS